MIPSNESSEEGRHEDNEFVELRDDRRGYEDNHEDE